MVFASTGHELALVPKMEQVLRPDAPATATPVVPGATFVKNTMPAPFESSELLWT